jgi:hypothetical protein
MRRNTSSRRQMSPGFGRRRRSFRANSEPSCRRQLPMLSCVTAMPRSARINSTSLRLRLNTWYSQTAWLISAGKRYPG